MDIIFLGPPGSGKGTQAERIAQQYHLEHLSTGDLFRHHIQNKTPLGKKASEYMEKGGLVPDEVTIGMVEDYLKQHKNVLFDGFPRTFPQGEALTALLKKQKRTIAAAVYLHVDDAVCVNRIILRGKQGSGRKDDNKQTAIKRLVEYHKKTDPLKTYYDQQQKLLIIKGMQEIDEVTNDIIRSLHKALSPRLLHKKMVAAKNKPARLYHRSAQ